MQMQIFRRGVLGLIALGLTVSMLAIFGCGGGDDNEVQKSANMQVANERPPISPTASGSGTAQLTISDDGSEVNFILTYTGLTNVTQAHIHVVNSSELPGPVSVFYCTNIGGAPAGTIGGQACPTSAGTVTGTWHALDLIPRDQTPTSPAALTFKDFVNLLESGNTYSNVHTQANPGGQIRGTNQ
jgi:hypothetical protein